MTREHIKASKRFKVLNRDGFACQYCGRKSPEVKLEIDHIKPVSKGGDNSMENLVTSCFDCNRGKTDKIIKLPEKCVNLIDFGNTGIKVERELLNILSAMCFAQGHHLDYELSRILRNEFRSPEAQKFFGEGLKNRVDDLYLAMQENRQEL